MRKQKEELPEKPEDDRKPIINSLLGHASEALIKQTSESGLNTGVEGNMLINIIHTRRYIQKMLWGLGIMELKALNCKLVMSMWVELMERNVKKDQKEKE